MAGLQDRDLRFRCWRESAGATEHQVAWRASDARKPAQLSERAHVWGVHLSSRRRSHARRGFLCTSPRIRSLSPAGRPPTAHGARGSAGPGQQGWTGDEDRRSRQETRGGILTLLPELGLLSQFEMGILRPWLPELHPRGPAPLNSARRVKCVRPRVMGESGLRCDRCRTSRRLY